MRIGIDASRANRELKTGTEWYSYYLIRAFASLDKDNEYILYCDKPLRNGLADLCPEYSGERLSEPEYDERGYQKLRSPHGNFKAKILHWPFKYFWTLGGLSLEMIFHKPDVLFVPSHVLPIFHPKRSIVTIHDVGFIKEAYLFAREEMGADTTRIKSLINSLVRVLSFGRYGANSFDYLRWSTSYALRNASQIISVSYFTKKELEANYKVDSDKIVVVHNGYPETAFQPIHDQEKIKQVLDNQGIEPPYFFYIGRLEKKKNVSTLVEAFAIFRDKYPDMKHKLVLVGNAGFGYDEIKYMTREFDIVDEVIMPGWLEEEYIPYLFAGATAFVFPSRYEGFGIPLVQAMAMGTPIAASRVSSIPEVAGEAAVYFHPDYALSIADAMYDLAAKPELVQANVAKGLTRAKMFSWEKCARLTLEIITSQKK